MKRELRVFFAAIGFFTRLPVPAWVGHGSDRLDQATRYFPLVGIIVGAIGASVTLAASLALPVALAVLAGMTATLLATGAFHEDGLADAVDGFGGGRDRARVLEIMKDSRIGSFGAIAVAMMLLAKFEALNAIGVRDGLASLALALLAAHAFSRLAASTLVFTLDYVREEEGAKSRPLAQPASPATLIVAAASGLAPCLLLDHRLAFVALGLATGIAFLAARYFVRRIGGYTGDCLGATQQLAEVAFYAGLLCVSS
jgi:adenosylcobinamide-GDP ribazoletransferase